MASFGWNMSLAPHRQCPRGVEPYSMSRAVQTDLATLPCGGKEMMGEQDFLQIPNQQHQMADGVPSLQKSLRWKSALVEPELDPTWIRHRALCKQLFHPRRVAGLRLVVFKNYSVTDSLDLVNAHSSVFESVGTWRDMSVSLGQFKVEIGRIAYIPASKN